MGCAQYRRYQSARLSAMGRKVFARSDRQDVRRVFFLTARCRQGGLVRAAPRQDKFDRHVVCVIAMKNLIICSASERSLHQVWLDGDPNRNWDLYLSPYRALAPRQSPDIEIGKIRSGPKFTCP